MKSFLALLIFLYTDTVPSDMTVGDYKELLVVADRFCLPQLISVCEAAITEKINAEIKKKRLNSAKCNDVINLLLSGQVGEVDYVGCEALDCKQSLFCSKIGGKNEKKKRVSKKFEAQVGPVRGKAVSCEWCGCWMASEKRDCFAFIQ